MTITTADRLNLGAGGDTRPNEWNVDCVDLAGIDEVVDLDEFPWPWDSSSWRFIRTKHVLEHLDDPMRAVSEIKRLLRDGGVWTLVYPIGHTRFEDPTHKHYWTYNTAATIVGDRYHSHEHVGGLDLTDRRVEWSIGNRWWRTYVRYRLWRAGPGAWLSQIPGLSGEVHATYRKQ